MRDRRSTTPAFTIFEMLVAISITVLMLVLINQLFRDTQRAVSVGIKTGEMLVESETIGDQLQRDADDMHGPGGSTDAGFLVIVNRTIGDDNKDGVYTAADDTGVPFKWPGGEERRDVVRSDQLIFITQRSGGDRFHAITPKTIEQLDTNISALNTRVWYGHAIRTLPDGTHNTADTLGDGIEPNLYANRWVLARHSTLLPVDGSPDSNFDTTATPTHIHAARAEWNEAITPNIGPTGSPKLFHGLTDVANQVLSGNSNAVIETIATAGYPAGTYPYAIPGNRPWVNPSPNTNDESAEENFVSHRVAQMHTGLANNVSDFIVEFAGDYSDGAGGPPDGEIDKDDQGTADPSDDVIKWYTHDAFANTGSDDTRPVTYAGSVVDNTTSGSDPNLSYYETGSLPATADAAFVWRHDDDDSSNSRWPYLIRIRYRMHDDTGRVRSTRMEDDGNTPGDTSDDQWESISGRWFEHIIPVARP